MDLTSASLLMDRLALVKLTQSKEILLILVLLRDL